MKTIIAKADTGREEVFALAGTILKKGGLVAFPTETVYGLGGDALRADAAHKIYRAKGRPSDNPLIVHIADTGSVYELASGVPKEAELLMEAFWPGPLTIIFHKKQIVPDATTGGLDTVAVRMPAHPAALKLIRDSGICIAAPSANLSGRPSPTTARHVIEDMNGRIDMILDGGPVGIGIESTIVDMTEEIPTILRPGYISPGQIEALLGNVRLDPALEHPEALLRPKAPGMKYTHYAPRGELTIVEGKTDRVVEEINRLTDAHEAQGHVTAVICGTENRYRYHSAHVLDAGSRSHDITVSSALYRLLRECDTLGAEYIYSESFIDGEMGYAIMNRLMKAAGHRIINVEEDRI